MKNNHMKLLNLSFNGGLKNYYKDDGTLSQKKNGKR